MPLLETEMETEDGRPETGDGRQETGDRRPETGDGKSRRETGDGRPETGDRREESASSMSSGGFGPAWRLPAPGSRLRVRNQSPCPNLTPNLRYVPMSHLSRSGASQLAWRVASMVARPHRARAGVTGAPARPRGGAGAAGTGEGAAPPRKNE